MNSNTAIICYLGGTCGDLVTALFDPTVAVLNKSTIKLLPEVSRLKKPHLFESDFAKDQYLAESSKYKSIASHDAAYHITKKHQFISIVSNNLEHNLWAATRFKNLHEPHVWNEMSRYSGASTIDEYAQLISDYSNMIRCCTPNTINLADIINGNLLSVLSQWTEVSQAGKNLYQNWLHNGNLHV